MPIDTQTPNSPGWWLKRLITRLGAQQSRYDMLFSYYQGTNVIPIHAAKACREAYTRLMQMSRTNFAELAIEAVRERMMPVGFRTGAEGDEAGDAEAWRIWQANSLDADAAMVHRDSLSMSMAYAIVGGVDEEIGAPLITPEDPREVIVETMPGRRRKVVAALKVFHDDVEGVVRAYVYLPGFVFRAAREAASGSVISYDESGWEWLGFDQLPRPVVPVIPFPNHPNKRGEGMGEIERHISILDRINFTVLNRVEIATLQAFKQRAVKGVPLKDEKGQRIDYDDIFSMDPAALWILPASAEIWESGQVDLGPVRQAIRDDVQDFAAVTRTPLFYLTPDATNGSAEGASLAREGLIFKANDRISQVTESWEDTMALAFLFAGDEERGRRGDMEVLWAPPERFSLSERYDAASKAAAAGVPWRTVMTDVLQFSPQQVDRMEGERATDLLLSTPLEPAVPVQPVA